METKSFFQTVLCGFGYDEVTTLEGIIEGFIRNFIPLDICFLIVGDDIAVGSIDFFKSITRADQHIFEICLAVRADDGIFIYGETGERSAEQVELHAFLQAVFGNLGNGQIAALQGVVKGHGRGLVRDNRYNLTVLRLIFIRRQLSHRIFAGLQIINCDLTTVLGFHGLIDAVTLNTETDTVDLAVLGGLNDHARAGNFLIDCIDRDDSFVCLSDGYIPLGLSVRSVVRREHSFYDTVIAVGNAVKTRVTLAVGGTDFILLGGVSRVRCSKNSTGKVFTVGIFLVDLNRSVIIDKGRSYNLYDRFRIATFTHSYDGRDFGASVIAYMGQKILSVVVTGIQSDMGDITSRNGFENNQGTNGDFLARHKITAVRTLRKRNSAASPADTQPSAAELNPDADL